MCIENLVAIVIALKYAGGSYIFQFFCTERHKYASVNEGRMQI